jgi:hypothetical protein
MRFRQLKLAGVFGSLKFCITSDKLGRKYLEGRTKEVHFCNSS